MNSLDLFDLSGKVAIVTGAGSGLGVVFSEALAETGAAVVCADINPDSANSTANRLSDAGYRAISTATDVTNAEAMTDLMNTAISQLGSVDIMVNNAGIAVAGPPEDTTLEDWNRLIDVNLTGVFLGARESAKAMIARGNGGVIINISSILGAVASLPVPAPSYAAAKGGVVNLTRDLAVHWAKYGIRVNAIGPAYFPSAMTHDFLEVPDLLASIEQRTPMGRIGRPEELKGPIVFLASQASSYLTGQTIFVDGGWTAW